MMRHRISAGVLALHDDRILLVRHYRPGRHDFWSGPGGGVEGSETLEAAAAREAYEETGVKVEIGPLAYMDELVDDSGRMVKFWFLARYLTGDINVTLNPAPDESIVEAGWFAQNALPNGYVFPEVLADRFWIERQFGFSHPVRLPLRQSIF